MGASLYLCRFALSCCFHLFIFTNSFSSAQPLCHEDESLALLQFKRSFFVDSYASSDPNAYPKVESWKLNGNVSDCCSWDGVECDHDAGHVIGLDLSSSFLYGSINSNSSLFSLVYLRRLNLADNDFNFSQIPPGIGHLSKLRSLNLSQSLFHGQIPLEISKLSLLTSLDLTTYDIFYTRFLRLQNPNLENLVKNLTKLDELRLTGVYMGTTVPDMLQNMTSLTALSISWCGLVGEFPRGIFNLPNLRVLAAAMNKLNGTLPEFHSGSRLEVLIFGLTSFRGNIPDSIGRLQSLRHLDLSLSNYSGPLPPSLGNLTRLTNLELRMNKFSGQVPSSLANLSQLTRLGLGDNNFDAGTLPLLPGKLQKLTSLFFSDMNLVGEIPVSLANLTQLSYLVLGGNKIVGKIPSFLMNLTQLDTLDISLNQLHGTIPSSISQLKNLEYLYLNSNSFTGIVGLEIFMNLKNLVSLHLSRNKLTVLTKNITNSTLPKFHMLGLETCDLTEFPDFLRLLDELEMLLLAKNKIRGPIPTWLWNTSKETLEVVDFGHNFLTGFEQNPVVIPWRNLKYVDLSSNKLQGSLPTPPPNTGIYKANNNLLTGEIPPSICHNNSLHMLDLSDNNLTGTIPPCLTTSCDDLHVLNLSRNSLHGSLPSTVSLNSQLIMIDLSQNQLQGPVPRLLANCRMLEILVLGNNQFEDTFPSWLGAIPELQVLVLRSNKFHGSIGNPKTDAMFPKLRILDLSSNGFSGNLPSEYFGNWKAMKMGSGERLTYMHTIPKVDVVDPGSPITPEESFHTWSFNYSYSITIASKGTQRLYEKIQSAFVAIDLSNNKFGGEIPASIGSLVGLQLLNVSNNNLDGVIPSSLASLTELESLDLSRNVLSGKIPQQLTQLTFLAVLDVSHNHLTGRIPQGRQFDTFENSSYDGNPGLCGVPLSSLCENSGSSPPPLHSSQGDETEFSSGVFWMVILMGFGSGLIVGLVIGTTLTRRYHEWFVDTFGRRKKIQKKQKRNGRRN
ncbi:receptor-like protein 7 [Rhododendron vialii]|uniref:receptor-like protein 7 n=1 Tax=Rhododendron vialii TaxID=182163 RepID=UPI00265E725A|nr:receptor-like protein 7 [Rhododendron vialii]